MKFLFERLCVTLLVATIMSLGAIGVRAQTLSLTVTTNLGTSISITDNGPGDIESRLGTLRSGYIMMDGLRVLAVAGPYRFGDGDGVVPLGLDSTLIVTGLAGATATSVTLIAVYTGLTYAPNPTYAADTVSNADISFGTHGTVTDEAWVDANNGMVGGAPGTISFGKFVYKVGQTSQATTKRAFPSTAPFSVIHQIQIDDLDQTGEVGFGGMYTEAIEDVVPETSSWLLLAVGLIPASLVLLRRNKDRLPA